MICVEDKMFIYVQPSDEEPRQVLMVRGDTFLSGRIFLLSWMLCTGSLSLMVNKTTKGSIGITGKRLSRMKITTNLNQIRIGIGGKRNYVYINVLRL